MVYDVIVVGSGMGGLSAALILAQKGLKVIVLEGNYLPGGCSSSYWRKGYIFESGATTLMGYDEGQPMHLLEQLTGLNIPKVHLDPSMTVHIDGKQLIRYENFDLWLQEATRHFSNPEAQIRFWTLAKELSDFVWKVSGKNLTFPPTNAKDVFELMINNHPKDVFKLRYAFRSVTEVLKEFNLHTDARFLRFLDEQLLITAQSPAADTPFLFAAPALCYTNYRNYYLRGGMIFLPMAVIEKIGSEGGDVRLREKVTEIGKAGNIFRVQTEKGNVYQSKRVLSNIPIWNLPEILADKEPEAHFTEKGNKIRDYWGAFTMGIATEDTFADDLTLHHQFILPEGQSLKYCGSRSVFVSVSERGDMLRAPVGQRVLSVSTHVHAPQTWFELEKEEYYRRKEEVTEKILEILCGRMPGLSREKIVYQTASTPISWHDWTFRKHGTVGGIPQSMKRPLWEFTGSKTKYKNLFLCGDTVYPGQGIPGVTLGGIIAARRIEELIN